MTIPRFLFGNDVFNAQETRRNDMAAVAENSARPAVSFNDYESTGTGQIVTPGPLMFDVTFTDRPVLASGLTLLRGAGEHWSYPLVTAGVYKWATDDRGYYLGAYVYLNVKVEAVPASTKLVEGAQLQLDRTVSNIQVYIARLESEIAVMRSKRANWGTAIIDKETELARAKAQLVSVQANQASRYAVSSTTYVGPEEAKQLQTQRNYYKGLLAGYQAAGTQASLEYAAAQSRLLEIDARLASGAQYRSPQPIITHHLMFYGPAMKDLPQDVTAGLTGQLVPNTPGGSHA